MPVRAARPAAGPAQRPQRGALRMALAFAALLAALTFVIWRQSGALELLRAMDGLRAEQVVVEAERAALERRIQQLERRGRVIEAAGDRLGMRVPSGHEVVILPAVPFEGGADGR